MDIEIYTNKDFRDALSDLLEDRKLSYRKFTEKCDLSFQFIQQIATKKALPPKDKFIEKRRYGIDKIGEKRGLSLSKFLKQRRTGSRKPVSRISKTKGKKRTRVFIKKRVKRVSPKIKMQRIKSLIKARRVLKQRRKRK